MIDNRRIGRFRLSVSLINSQPEVVRQALGNVIVLDARPDVTMNDIEYVGICPDFAELEIGAYAPLYVGVCMAHQQPDGSEKHVFSRWEKSDA